MGGGGIEEQVAGEWMVDSGKVECFGKGGEGLVREGMAVRPGHVVVFLLVDAQRVYE